MTHREQGDALDPRIVAFHVRALDLLGRAPNDHQRIQALLTELAAEPDILPQLDLPRLHSSGSTATILIEGEDGGGALMLLRLPPEAPTPVHNHNTWGVSCVIAGRNRYWRWERWDDGADPDRGDLRLAQVIDQAPGDSTLWDDPPGDWHAQQGIDGDAFEFVFFGMNPLRRPRAYYEPETGEITYAYASDAMPDGTRSRA